jgi:peptidoglycan/LPS O-acetylase OafA/YrhL
LYLLTSWCFLVLVEPQLFSSPARQLWANVLSHAFFVHNLSPVYAGALNGPAWSIGVEMQFYIFMALVFKWLPVRRPILVCFTFIAAALAWRTGMWYTFDQGLDISILISRCQQFPAVLDAFGLGCALALIVRNQQYWLHRYLQTNWKNSIMWLAIAILFSVVSWKILWLYTEY